MEQVLPNLPPVNSRPATATTTPDHYAPGSPASKAQFVRSLGRPPCRAYDALAPRHAAPPSMQTTFLADPKSRGLQLVRDLSLRHPVFPNHRPAKDDTKAHRSYNKLRTKITFPLLPVGHPNWPELKLLERRVADLHLTFLWLVELNHAFEGPLSTLDELFIAARDNHWDLDRIIKQVQRRGFLQNTTQLAELIILAHQVALEYRADELRNRLSWITGHNVTLLVTQYQQASSDDQREELKDQIPELLTAKKCTVENILQALLGHG